MLDGKTCLVTGAGSGIGAATSRLLAQAGATVVLADLSEASARAQREALGAPHVALALDVGDRQAVQAAVDDVVERFGRLDAAFNNAGIMGPWRRLADVGPADWEPVRETNLDGTLHCLSAELSVMADQGHGAIVNCASVAGFSGFPEAGTYAATKHAILGLTRTAALEHADQGIRVNAVCPGPVDTPLLGESVEDDGAGLSAIAEAQPNGRLIEPEEVGQAVVFLLGEAASGINGTCLVVDGGLSAR